MVDKFTYILKSARTNPKFTFFLGTIYYFSGTLPSDFLHEYPKKNNVTFKPCFF
jgi:hypothetical protein